MKTALVCGAGGFIGSHLVKILKKNGKTFGKRNKLLKKESSEFNNKISFSSFYEFHKHS